VPLAPVGPVTPLIPFAPVAPVEPLAPVAPVAPIAPVYPVGPIGPVVPVPEEHELQPPGQYAFTGLHPQSLLEFDNSYTQFLSLINSLAFIILL
jgi:hypothetical protein